MDWKLLFNTVLKLIGGWIKRKESNQKLFNDFKEALREKDNSKLTFTLDDLNRKS